MSYLLMVHNETLCRNIPKVNGDLLTASASRLIDLHHWPILMGILKQLYSNHC